MVALEDLGDVTLQAHLGAATPTEHAALYREAVALIELLQRRGAELASGRLSPLPDRVRRREADLGARFLRQHFVEGYREPALSDARARGARRGVGGDRGRARRGAPRAVPSRLPQPQPDAARGRLYIIDFQDARHGPDTYDLVSLLRDSYVDITDRELDDLIAYFLALKGGADAARVPAAVRSDGAAAQSQGARHIRLPDDRPAPIPVYIQYMPRTLRYARTNLESIRASPACASCLPATSRSSNNA